MTTRQPIPYVEGHDELWCQLCPFGEFPVMVEMPDGKMRRIVQICDRQAFNKLIETFAAERLVDFEHRSDAGGLASDTTAAAWMQELKVDDTHGLMVRNKLTDLGAADLRNRRRRFLSPVWDLDEDGRPCLLRKAALTNTPNIKAMQPVLNKESPATAAGTKKGVQTMDLKQIALALGLAETATAEEVLAAAKAAKEKAASLETRVAELEKTQLEGEAEKVCAANKGRIGDEAGFRKLYVANKAFALQALETMPKVTVANKADGKKPEGLAAGDSAKEQARATFVDEVQKRPGFASRADAVARAQAEKPELWQ
jgi:phage I-like protein